MNTQPRKRPSMLRKLFNSLNFFRREPSSASDGRGAAALEHEQGMHTGNSPVKTRLKRPVVEVTRAQQVATSTSSSPLPEVSNLAQKCENLKQKAAELASKYDSAVRDAEISSKEAYSYAENATAAKTAAAAAAVSKHPSIFDKANGSLGVPTIIESLSNELTRVTNGLNSSQAALSASELHAERTKKRLEVSLLDILRAQSHHEAALAAAEDRIQAYAVHVRHLQRRLDAALDVGGGERGAGAAIASTKQVIAAAGKASQEEDVTRDLRHQIQYLQRRLDAALSETRQAQEAARQQMAVAQQLKEERQDSESTVSRLEESLEHASMRAEQAESELQALRDAHEQEISLVSRDVAELRQKVNSSAKSTADSLDNVQIAIQEQDTALEAAAKVLGASSLQCSLPEAVMMLIDEVQAIRQQTPAVATQEAPNHLKSMYPTTTTTLFDYSAAPGTQEAGVPATVSTTAPADNEALHRQVRHLEQELRLREAEIHRLLEHKPAMRSADLGRFGSGSAIPAVDTLQQRLAEAQRSREEMLAAYADVKAQLKEKIVELDAVQSELKYARAEVGVARLHPRSPRQVS